MSTYLEYKQNVKVVKKIKRKTIFFYHNDDNFLSF